MDRDELGWTQHEVSFGVWDGEKCAGLLRLVPPQGSRGASARR